MTKSVTRRFCLILAMLLTFSLLISACSKKKDSEKASDNAERNEFIDDIGGVSETFKGSVSQESFSDPDDAAEAFVSEELAGDGSATIHEVKSNGELSAKQIKALNIPEEILDGSDAVEEMEVSYSLEAKSELARGSSIVMLGSEKLNKQATVKVYVIKYEHNWKYFSPMPVTGATISRSYYDSVFNYEKYKNCTMEMNSSVDAEAVVAGESIKMTMSSYQLYKYADGKVYIEEITKTTINGQTETDEIYGYLETVDGVVQCYVKLSENGDWMLSNMEKIGFSTLDELTPFYGQYLDYTYFTKTDYGFALADENARQYFQQALADSLSAFSSMIDPDKMDLDMFAEYYVSDGVLSGIRLDADIDMSVGNDTETITLKISENATSTCTDYGKTVVEKPFED